MTVYAAGAICWREENGELLVAIIHRNRYKDWSWPKGKLDSGETLPEAAVREIREETGLKVKLGIPLGVQKYKLQNGLKKEVHYWAARVSDSALENSTFKPDDEVEAIDWKTPAQARKLLTYDHDGEILDKLIAHHKSGTLRTKPFVVLRHAKATPRSDWKRGEHTRPLLPLGELQAKALTPLLSAFGVRNLVTSPWARCVTTVLPYARKKQIKVIERDQLTEFANAKGPLNTARVVKRELNQDKATVLCSHRPALPTILDVIATKGTSAQASKLKKARDLDPGSMLVVHLSLQPDGERRIVALETHSPFAKK